MAAEGPIEYSAKRQALLRGGTRPEPNLTLIAVNNLCDLLDIRFLFLDILLLVACCHLVCGCT